MPDSLNPLDEQRLSECITAKEKSYERLSWVCSILGYLLLLFYAISSYGIILILLFSFVLLGWFATALLVGQLQGNAVRVNDEQFPEVYKIAQDLAKRMNLKELPHLYVVEQGGALNAFATRFARRNYAVFYSNILELAYENGQDSLAFVVAHELAHIKRQHIQKHMWLTPGFLCIPFLQNAYSRACEYTCDAMASYLVPKGAESGIKLLAVGKLLQNRVNSGAWIKQAEKDAGFWCWSAEIFGTHPHLYKRLQAVKQQVL